MWKRRLYYLMKPVVPWQLRMALRRKLACRRRAQFAPVWPIDGEAARVPPSWPGWPDGHRFAVVLTHDVEGPAGLAKVRKLAELERSMGFHSSFNFIPEGDYRVSRDLREWLAREGFEVGVHDLEHNGKLFGSYPDFLRKAEQINRYLYDWGAAGFRAGFMLRNLEWIHELNVQYDASTFDTDPFEPQSDGARTIFPFFIDVPDVWAGFASPPETPPTSRRGGYVELPYTLPQDSTLFLVLQETSPEIWLQKSDWLARQGGMVLVNVHPDYIQFDGEAASPRTFPVAYYREFLEHLRTRHTGKYWQPLARDLAAWYRVARRPNAPLAASASSNPFS